MEPHSRDLRLIRKRVPAIAQLNAEDARVAVATAWRSAFMEHRVVGILMIPGMILLAFAITLGIALLLDFVLIPRLAVIPDTLRLGISLVAGYLVGMPAAMRVYDRWRVRLIVAKLRG